MREYESGSPIFMPSVSHACRKNIPELRSQKRYSNQHFITWFDESSEVEDIEENERMRMGGVKCSGINSSGTRSAYAKTQTQRYAS